VSLAPPKQGVSPRVANLTAEALQSSEIAGNRMVVEVNHPPTPKPWISR
jgi:hypothetical protein